VRIASRRRRPSPEGGAGPVYCDASALVKLYLPEPGSDELNRALQGRRDLLASDLAVTEIISSIARRLRDGAVTADVAARLHRAILADFESGVYLVVDLVRDTHREAERLLLALKEVPLRAADALHLALATRAGAAAVLTFDNRLGEAARAVGLGIFAVPAAGERRR
jgi:predicted nucleic acid-binding protein